MRKHGMFIAIGLLVLVNTIVLAGIAYNRSGEPAATITLTERELPLVSYYRYDDRENTGLSLRIDWSNDSPWHEISYRWSPWRKYGRDEWIDKTKLEAIGFDCKFPIDDPKADLHYPKMLPRKTYAVLEYEGSAWKKWLADSQSNWTEVETNAEKGTITQDELKRARAYYENECRTHSRLFVIDVGNDSSALRKQYSEQGRYLIMPATVRLHYYPPSYTEEGKKKEPPYIMGRIDDVLTDTIYVPKEHRHILEKVMEKRRQNEKVSGDLPGSRDSYKVKLQVGKRAEPWIVAIRELSPEVPK
jgi:hypothetical protein